MPKLNLRLTEDQHAELTRAAEAADRSLQAEVISRCFQDARWPALAAEGHFKPDPKPSQRAKR